MAWLSDRLPAFLKVLFAGRGSDTETRAVEKMYPETDVIIATATCARHCSFCFREVGDPQGEASRITGNMEAVMNAVNEVIAHKVPHVLVTGGDPLTRSNQQLKQMLSPLAESETVEVLRLATRMIVDLPMRFFDKDLLAVLSELARTMKRRHASFRIVTHVNHPCELTPDAIKAIENVQACGIEIMNQTTVLAGVNDSATTLQELLMKLDRLDVRNHKLFQTMPVKGTEHLRIPIRKFRQLVATLHQWLPGTSVPQANIVTLVGKIPVQPKGRQIIPVPFTNRLLVHSFRGEWHLFKDVWDIGRHLREAGATLVAATLLIAVVLLSHKSDQKTVVSLAQSQTITRVAVLADEMDYPDYWARQRFTPFVQGKTLYIPIQGISTKG
jgi:KamA family protein